MANGDMLPLWHPCRNLRVESLGMLGDYKIWDTVLKSQNDGAEDHTHRGIMLDWSLFLANGAWVTYTDPQSEIETGKQQSFL